MFDVEPNLTLPVNTIPAISYQRHCFKIDISTFPTKSGIYVLRYKYLFPRLHGKSNILKVGQTSNYKKRFRSYNGKCAATSFDSIIDLRKFVDNSWTEFHFMWMVSKLNPNNLTIDFYFSDDIKDMERRFILAVLEKHWELPPLNLDMGRS